ncbi:MAG TPA: hypothetical protein VI306_19925 [Pyrinomonadaceae bacterium]
MNQIKSKMCIAPEIGKFVPDYIVDLLSDSEALKVELHLVDCYSCKEHYHTVLRASAEMRERVSTVMTGGERVMLSREEMSPTPKGQIMARQKEKYVRKASGGI